MPYSDGNYSILNRQGIHRSRHPLYFTWAGMHSRCRNPKNKTYHGRGITVCERWLSFNDFCDDMGPCPSSRHTIERIDGSKGYIPDNCRWATYTEQNQNTRKNVILEHDGNRFCVSEWARRVGISTQTIDWRLGHGWSVKDTLTIRPKEARPRPEDIEA